MNIRNMALTGLVLFPLYSYADPITIITPDIYRGEVDHNYGDVIGTLSYFDATQVSVTRDADTEILDVNLTTNFAGNAGDPAWHYVSQNGLGVGYGDVLFGSYNPDSRDTATETWGTITVTHAFILDNGFNNTGGTGTLLSVANLDLLLTEDLMQNAIFRNTAPVMVDRNDPDLTTTPVLSTGTWSVGSGVLNFSINSFTIDPEVLYWTMGCGNDLVIGLVPEGGGGGQGGEEDVPTPGTLSLLFAGLFSLFNRKRLV